MTQLAPGDKAPNFTLPATDGTQIDLYETAARSEKGVIVYFYPRAGTPGCTKQACDFRDNQTRLEKAGYTIIGISPDAPTKLAKFADGQTLGFTLVSDTDKNAIETWGAWGEKKNYGKTYTGLIRSTIVVAPDATVTLAQYNVRAAGHVERLIKALGIDK